MKCKWCGKEFTEKTKLTGICSECVKECNPLSLKISNLSFGLLVVELIGSILITISGIILYSEEGEITFLTMGIVSFIISILSYYLLIGFAEIIRLLDKISKK